MKKHTLILTAIAILLVACGESKNDPTDGNSVSSSVPAQISGEIENRVNGDIWNANDSIGIFMIKNRQILNAGNIVENVDNRKYTSAPNLQFVPGDESQTIYYPANGDSVDFIAYFPYQKILKANYVYPIDLNNQEIQETLDLLYADKVNDKFQANPKLNFAFKHKLSKLVLEVKAGTGVTKEELSKVTVEVTGMNTLADFDLNTGEIQKEKVIVPILMKKIEGEKRFEATLFPCVFEEGQTLIFHLNNDKQDSFIKELTLDDELKTSKILTYSVEVFRTEIRLSGKGQITDWGVGKSNTGNVEF